MAERRTRILREAAIPSAGQVRLARVLFDESESYDCDSGTLALIAHDDASQTATELASVDELDDYLHDHGSSLAQMLRENASTLTFALGTEYPGRLVESLYWHRKLYESVPEYVSEPIVGEDGVEFWLAIGLDGYRRGRLSFRTRAVTLSKLFVV